ncbi:MULTISPECIES: aldo/keto reductase [Halococcus]|uniref:Aldo/keto reductase n=1 Tax=Halococcus salifodinae DSM 8989 TaxID=1227456 RepID=M0N7E6_9EURY|nr:MULTISPECIES: aldo/keto reductase [Halococcus]EMA53478.1 aldo/keto reductase [Halococcus salifodinae DSM 8989]
MQQITVDGTTVPALGFGTSGMDTDDERYRAVSAALDAGYRHVDTAQMYESESAVGDAMGDSGIDREEVFVTTKLLGENRAHDAVIESTRDSLDRLDTEYVDLLLIHSPDQEVAHEETLDAMNELVEEGTVENIGVSNFSVEETRAAIEHSDAPILTNQVEYNVHERRDDLLSLCLDEDVMLTAYSPLGVGDCLDNEVVTGIADDHDKTAAQVAIRWLLQQPLVSPIPMSSNPEHVRANADVFDFELTDDEMRDLFAIGGDLDDDLAGKLGL